jgi:hypothetical protein
MDKKLTVRIRRLPEAGKAAIFYARCGLSVFGLTPNSRIPLTGSHGFHDATTDIEKICTIFEENPNANLGIATGAKSGVWVLDIDMKNGKDGEAELRKLEAKYGALPPTLTQDTPSDGRQMLWRYDADHPVESVADIYPGIDTRGDKGYATIAPSVARSKNDGELKPYRFPTTPPDISLIGPAPLWLYEALQKTEKRKRAKACSIPAMIPTELYDMVQPISERGRHQHMLSVIGYLFSHLHPFAAEGFAHAFNKANCHPPLPEDENQRMIDDIAAKELAKLKGVRHA